MNYTYDSQVKMENKKVKIVIKGPAGSGKTTFLSKISDNIQDSVYHDIEDVEIYFKKFSIAITNNYLNVLDEQPDIIIHINSIKHFDENYSSSSDYSILNLFDDNFQEQINIRLSSTFPKHNNYINLKNADPYKIKSILNNLISKYVDRNTPIVCYS